jgi:hypothetical protein
MQNEKRKKRGQRTTRSFSAPSFVEGSREQIADIDGFSCALFGYAFLWRMHRRLPPMAPKVHQGARSDFDEKGRRRGDGAFFAEPPWNDRGKIRLQMKKSEGVQFERRCWSAVLPRKGLFG